MRPIHRGALVLFLVLVVAALPILAFSQPAAEKPLPNAEKSAGKAAISTRGRLMSAPKTEVRWEGVLTPPASARIAKIAPDGSAVKQGDVLVEFECDQLADERAEAEVQALKAQAAVIQATSRVEVAKVGLEEYQEGHFKVQLQTLQAEMEQAQETRRRAADRLASLKKKAGETRKEEQRPDPALEEATFALLKAETDFGLAAQKRAILEKYTKLKTRLQLEAAIKSAGAELRAVQAEYDFRTARVNRLRKAAEKCVVRASAPGQVVYRTPIREGQLVQPGQTVLESYDPKQLRVEALMTAAQADRLAPGTAAVFRADAFPDRALTGVVEKVDKVERPGTPRGNAPSKVVIRIPDLPAEFRPGLTGDVRIEAGRSEEK